MIKREQIRLKLFFLKKRKKGMELDNILKVIYITFLVWNISVIETFYSKVYIV